jgi:benzoyl-CoA reductase/2-hydroxyglutaryl-CoA dehydratase subunit BcrC/BadD/HgdB
MSKLEKNISFLTEAAQHPAKSIARALERKKTKAIGCLPYYVPEEIIHASGLLPVGLWGGKVSIEKTDSYMQSFGCSLIRNTLELALNGTYSHLAGIVVTAFCDTLKSAGVDLKVIVPDIPIIPVVWAQNRQNPEGMTFTREEFTALKEKIETIAGERITEIALQKSLTLYEEYRTVMRAFSVAVREHPDVFDPVVRHKIIKAGQFMDKQEYVAVVKEILEEVNTKKTGKEPGYIRVVLSGIMADSDHLLQTFKDHKFHIVADDLAQESRQFRTAAPEGGNVIERLVNRARAIRGCSLFYEEDRSRGRYLLDLMRRNDAQALVVCMLKFCDPEGFDYPEIKKAVEASGRRLLTLEVEQNMESVGQIITRVQSFAEMFA